MTTKLHAVCETQGLPVKFVLTPGQNADITHAAAFLPAFPTGSQLLADKGYDSDAFIEALQCQQVIPQIPPRKNRDEQRPYDKAIYKHRNKIERLFLSLKRFRSIATRYAKRSVCFMAFVALASAALWIKHSLQKRLNTT